MRGMQPQSPNINLIAAIHKRGSTQSSLGGFVANVRSLYFSGKFLL